MGQVVPAAADLTALQRDLKAISATAMGNAKRRTRRLRQRHLQRQCRNSHLAQRMTRRVAARDDGALEPGAVDQLALDATECPTKPLAGRAIKGSTAIGGGAEGCIE